MNKAIGKINILGTEYRIFLADEKSDKVLEGKNGYCDWTHNKIVLDVNTTNSTRFRTHILTHEIVHSFLHESGLQGQGHSEWAIDEEVVDWIAFMIDKLFNARKQMIKFYCNEMKSKKRGDSNGETESEEESVARKEIPRND